VLVAVGSAVVVAAGVIAVRSVELTSLEVTGIADGQELSRGELDDVRIVIDRDGLAAGDVRVELNGTELPTVEEDGQLVARLGAVEEGEHELVVSLDGKLFLDGERVERRFVVMPPGPDIYAPDERSSSRCPAR
jgi:hypothetical protein